MKALVTGGNGFIGSWVCRELLKENIKVKVFIKKNSSLENLQGVNVEIFRGSIENIEDIENALNDCDIVFHLAALHTHWLNDFKVIYNINVQGTKNLLNASVKYGIKKFIFTSTQNIIAYKKNSISNENDIITELKDQSYYTKSKYLAEIEVLKSIEKGLNAVILNISGPFGSGDKKPGPTGNLIYSFLKKKFLFYSDTWFNAVSVKDVAKSHIQALIMGTPGERYIISNLDLSLHEFYTLLEKVSGQKKIKIKIPIWFAYFVAVILKIVSKLVTHKSYIITVDRIKQKRKKKKISNKKSIKKLLMSYDSIENSLKEAVNYFNSKI